MPIKSRPSSIPLLMACPASHADYSGTLQVDLNEDGPALLGTTVHALHAIYIGGQEAEAFELSTRAAHWSGMNLNADEVSFLFREGVRLYQKVKDKFPLPQNGWLLRCEDFEGTPDVLHIDTDWAAVLDFKNGWGRALAYDQIMAYLWLIRCNFPGKQRYYAFILHNRHDLIERYQIDDAGLVAWHERYKAAEAQSQQPQGLQYRLNRHCENCRRLLECPAIKASAAALAMIDVDAQAIRDPHGNNSLLVNLHYTRNALKAIERIKQTVDNTLDAMLEQMGTVTFPGGKSMTRKVRWKKTYDTVQALPVLRQILGQHSAGIARINTAAIKRACEAAAPDRWRQLLSHCLEQLAQAGALNEHPETYRSEGEEDDATQTESRYGTYYGAYGSTPGGVDD